MFLPGVGVPRINADWSFRTVTVAVSVPVVLVPARLTFAAPVRASVVIRAASAMRRTRPRTLRDRKPIPSPFDLMRSRARAALTAFSDGELLARASQGRVASGGAS